MPERERLTPRRGRPRDDVKQVKIPEALHHMLYGYARAHNMTFGDAAARLIGASYEDLVSVRPGSPTKPLRGGGRKRQVKVPKAVHALVVVFAETRDMTIEDAAALLIGVGLMKTLHLDPGAVEGKKRLS